VPAPYWPSFPDIIKINDGKVVTVPGGENVQFKLTAEALADAITPRTRWLVLNTPSNPTGAIYSGDELAALAAVLRANSSVLVLLDEVYEHIRFTPEPPPHLLHVAPDLRDRVLVVNGASKTYAMTGWRIGYGGGPAPLIKAMTVVQSQFTSGASSISQAAALAALDGDQAFVATAQQAYQERRRIVIDSLSKIPGLSLLPPDGAFFIYPGCAGVIGKTRPDGRRIETDDDFVEYLLEDVGVAAVAGSGFGLSPYFRLSFAASTSDIAKAVTRIGDAVARLT
jgi:aspartate aminotransferase